MPLPFHEKCKGCEKVKGDSDSDSDSDSEFEFIGGGLSEFSKNPENPPACGKPVDNSNQRPPPQLLQILKDKAKAAGYFYDEPVIRKIASGIPNPDWITSKHSIVKFVAEKIRDTYGGKPQPEQRKLFASAFAWENIHEEYAEWLAKQIKADERRELDRLRNTPPKQCPKCRITLSGNSKCKKCDGWVVFDEETRTWVCNEPFDFSFADCVERAFSERCGQARAPPENDDVDF